MVVTGIKSADWLAAFLERNRVAILAAAVLVSILLRVWLLSINADICPKCGDISNYVAKGKTLAGLNLNFFDPRYDEGTYAPLFEFALAAAIKLFGEGAIPLVAPFFGVLLIVATYFLGTAMFNTPTGVLAAIFVSVHPMLTVFGLVPLVESLFALLLVSAFVLFQKEKFLSSGILLGLAYLTKYNGMLAVLSLILYLSVWGGAEKRNRKLLSFLIGILLVTSPWLLRNYALFGNPFHSSDVPRFLGTVSMAAEKPAGPLLYLAGLPIYVGQPFVLLAALGLALSSAYWRKFLPILLTIGAFFAFFSLWPTKEFRHMITIVPFIVAFSAYGFLGLSRFLTASSSGKHAGAIKAIIALVLAEIIFDNLVATYAFTKALDALVSIGKLLKG